MPKGTCRYCGCTPARPCLFLPAYFGERIKICAWADSSKTLCSRPSCLNRAKREEKTSRGTELSSSALLSLNPPLRADIHPLCPIHNLPMNAERNRGFACSRDGCLFRWGFEEGYFQQENGTVQYPNDVYQLLKPAFLREHGYMYIASIQEPPHMRTWRCAVVDCRSKIVAET
jgi:hypothetical protein